MAPEGPRGRRLQVLVADEEGRRLAAPGIARWLSRVAPPRARGVVGVALASDARVRDLNKRYRRRDFATDVLSFAEMSEAPGPTAVAPELKLGPTYLGDIVIARGVARKQAREAGHSELTELRVLALHGLLHLLGYDHDRDAGRMARLERTLRAKGGLRLGLIERAGNPRRNGTVRRTK
jgi:probable rRNA maturation factor